MSTTPLLLAACDGICVKDVLRAVPQSRRVLETRFQKLLGRTPHDEIIRVQLHKVKTLLTESDLSLEQIAGRAGSAAIAVAAGHAYVAVSNFGLQIVDVTDPSAPSVLGELVTGAPARSLAYLDGRIYMTEEDSLRVIDVVDIRGSHLGHT